MTSSNDAQESGAHTHGGGVHLDPPAIEILRRGLRELLRLTDLLNRRPELGRFSLGWKHRVDDLEQEIDRA